MGIRANPLIYISQKDFEKSFMILCDYAPLSVNKYSFIFAMIIY